MEIKAILCSTIGAIGAAISQLFGGWSFSLTALLICMAFDYITGLIVAGVFHASTKTENGRLESNAGWKGLARKIVTVVIVVVAHLIDRIIGTDYIRDAVAIAFILNEVISILENAGLMGVPIPKVMKKALEVLHNKSGEDEDGGGGE